MEKTINAMKKYLFFIVFLISVILFSACNPATFNSEPTAPPEARQLIPVKVAYISTNGTQAVVLYAFEKGLFKKYGLDVKLSYISGGTTALTALLAGDVDFSQSAGSTVLSAVIAKQDAVLIAGQFNSYPGSLMALPEIKTMTDLKGKAIGINQMGDISDAITRIVFSKNGLDPTKDVTFVAVGESAQRLEAMNA